MNFARREELIAQADEDAHDRRLKLAEEAKAAKKRGNQRKPKTSMTKKPTHANDGGRVGGGDGVGSGGGGGGGCAGSGVGRGVELTMKAVQ